MWVACVIWCAVGTPASASQMAKDVCTFLKWSAGECRNASYIFSKVCVTGEGLVTSLCITIASTGYPGLA